MVTATTVRAARGAGPPPAPRPAAAAPRLPRPWPPAHPAPRPPRAERVERRRAACRARPPHVPLTELGHHRPRQRRPAELAGGAGPGALMSSDLLRAVQTAEHCAARHRPAGEHHAGAARAGVRRARGAARRASCGTSSTGPIRTGRPRAARASPSCTAGSRRSSTELRADPPADVVALVTHGDTIRAAQAVAAGLGPDAAAGGHPAQRHRDPAGDLRGEPGPGARRLPVGQVRPRRVSWSTAGDDVTYLATSAAAGPTTPSGRPGSPRTAPGGRRPGRRWRPPRPPSCCAAAPCSSTASPPGSPR